MLRQKVIAYKQLYRGTPIAFLEVAVDRMAKLLRARCGFFPVIGHILVANLGKRVSCAIVRANAKKEDGADTCTRKTRWKFHLAYLPVRLPLLFPVHKNVHC